MSTTPQPQPDILDQLRPELDKLIKDKIDTEVDLEKTWQVGRLAKADNYNRYLTNIAPYFTAAGQYGYSPIGVPNSPTTEQFESRGLYDYNIDIIKSYGRKYVGVLGPRPFHNCKAVPDDPQSEADRRVSRQMDLAALWLRSKWNIRKKNIDLFFNQWEAGTVYAYLNYVADKDVFGETEEPEYEQRQVELEPAGYKCQQCGEKSPEPATTESLDENYNPVQQMVCPKCGAEIGDVHFEDAVTGSVPEFTGNRKYPGSGPSLRFCTGYTVTVPFDCTDLDKSPYLLYEYEENQGVLLGQFGQSLREHVDENGNFKTSSRTAAQQQAVIARAQASSLTAMPRQGVNSRWTYSRYWLQPSMYEYVKDESLRGALQQQFEDGILVHRVEGVTVKVEPDSLAKHWVAIEPEPGKYLYHDPVCWGVMGQQDVLNDLWNIIIATLERGLPTALVDPDVIDTSALSSRPYVVNELIEARPGVGARLDSAIKPLPKSEFPDQIPQVLGSLEATVQQNLGLLPPVWGGGEKTQTAEDSRNRLNQALMQLGIAGEYATQGWVKVFEKAINLISEHAPKGFAVANNGTSEMLDLEALRNGKAHFEGEPGIPRSFAELRDQMDGIIKENPEVAHAMGMDSPINIPVVRDYLLPGMTELRIPQEDERDKVLETIQQLLEQEPIEQMGPFGPELAPSIPPEEYVDDPVLDAELVRQWIISPQGRKAKQDRPVNYRNVVAYGLALSKMAQPPMLPPGQATPPGGPPPDLNAPPEQAPEQIPEQVGA